MTDPAPIRRTDHQQPLTRPRSPVTASLAGVKPFRYYGGKARIANQLVALMPPHRIYVEPFLGSGAVICTKAPAAHELVNDLDDRLITFFRVLRDRPDDLATACRLTPYARSEYHHARHQPPDPDVDEVEIARRFFVTVSQSFAATPARSAGFSASLKKSVNRARSTQHTINRFHAVAHRFRHVQIECRPAWDLIDTYTNGLGPEALIYCDPPYTHSTRSGSYGYAHEMSDDDHRRLAQSLHNTNATVVLSGYPHRPLRPTALRRLVAPRDRHHRHRRPLKPPAPHRNHLVQPGTQHPTNPRTHRQIDPMTGRNRAHPRRQRPGLGRRHPGRQHPPRSRPVFAPGRRRRTTR